MGGAKETVSKAIDWMWENKGAGTETAEQLEGCFL